MNNLTRYVIGFLIGFLTEYLIRVDSPHWYFPGILIAVYVVLMLIDLSKNGIR